MLEKLGRWYRRRAVCCAVRITRRIALAVGAMLPVVLAPAMAETAQPDNTAGFVTQLGQIASGLYGAVQRDVVNPSRQVAADLLNDPRTIAAGEQLNAAARTVATTAQRFVLEPVVRESAEVLGSAELRDSYQAIETMAHSAGDALRRAILTPAPETADDELAASAAALSWIATAADVPRPPLSSPNLPDRDMLRRLEGDDPLEPLNRLVFAINRQFQSFGLDPLTRFYLEQMPPPVRLGLRNFFRNLREPATLVSSALEGEMNDAGIAGARFGINSTLGIAGFFDPATEMGLTVRARGFEHTLCRLGLPSGPYLVLPVLGPATLRDSVGRIATVVMYFEVMGLTIYLPYRLGDIAVQYAEAKTTQDLVDSLSSDPYIAQKIFYRITSGLGCGRQAEIERDVFTP
jgi:ABC-type transporter lipoprotein component MlaA